MASNQTDITQAPFLPMGRQGHQGYEAHYQVSETFEVTQFHCHDYFEFYIHVRGGEYMGVDNQLFLLKPNQVFILPPFCMHGLSCTTGRLTWISSSVPRLPAVSVPTS